MLYNSPSALISFYGKWFLQKQIRLHVEVRNPSHYNHRTEATVAAVLYRKKEYSPRNALTACRDNVPRGDAIWESLLADCPGVATDLTRGVESVSAQVSSLRDVEPYPNLTCPFCCIRLSLHCTGWFLLLSPDRLFQRMLGAARARSNWLQDEEPYSPNYRHHHQRQRTQGALGVIVTIVVVAISRYEKIPSL